MDSDDIKTCDHCEVQHDCADIYPVGDEELCEGCKATSEKLKVLRSITGVELEQMAKTDPHMCKHLVMHLAPLIGWVAYIDTRKLTHTITNTNER